MATGTKHEVCRGQHPGDLYLRRRVRHHGRFHWLRALRRQATSFVHRLS